MMIEPEWKVYRGMIVGEHTRGNDLEVNVLKGKKLTNIRTHAKDEAIRLTPPIRMTLEKALAYVEDDELVEVTPKSIRLAKSSSIRTNARRTSGARKPSACESLRRSLRAAHQAPPTIFNGPAGAGPKYSDDRVARATAPPACERPRIFPLATMALWPGFR